MAIVLLGKVDFMILKITRDKFKIHNDKRVNSIKMQNCLQWICNIISKCTWQKSEKGDTDKSITTKVYFSITFSGIHRNRQSISRNIENLNNTIDKLDLVDIYRFLQPRIRHIFPSIHVKHLVIQVSGNKALNKFQRISSYCMCSYHFVIELNFNKTIRMYTWKLKTSM